MTRILLKNQNGRLVETEEVIDLIRRKTLEVLPGLDSNQITPDRSLEDIGANSIDRVEVLTLTLEELRLEIPATKLAGAKSIGALAELIEQYLRGAEA